MAKTNPKIEPHIEDFARPGHVAANNPQQTLKRAPPPANNTNACQNPSIRKKRQTARKTRNDVITNYKNDVSSVWIEKPIYCTPWYQPEGFYLDCRSIDPDRLPIGFTHVGDERYQYNFTDPEALSSKRYRPVAYRVPFIADPNYFVQAATVSHLCHNNWCYNWKHHTLESLDVNKSRNGCPGGPCCRHQPKCMIPGRFSESQRLVRLADRNTSSYL